MSPGVPFLADLSDVGIGMLRQQAFEFRSLVRGIAQAKSRIVSEIHGCNLKCHGNIPVGAAGQFLGLTD